jgi:hypothetical protein
MLPPAGFAVCPPLLLLPRLVRLRPFRFRLPVGFFLGEPQRAQPGGLRAHCGGGCFVFGRGFDAVARLQLFALELGFGLSLRLRLFW